MLQLKQKPVVNLLSTLTKNNKYQQLVFLH